MQALGGNQAGLMQALGGNQAGLMQILSSELGWRLSLKLSYKIIFVVL